MNEAHINNMNLLTTELDEGYSVDVTEGEATGLFTYMMDEGYDLDDYREHRYGNHRVSIWRA